MTNVVMGIDMGGTGTRFVVRGESGVLRDCSIATATLGAGLPEARVDRLVESIMSLLVGEEFLTGVGIGASGPLDLLTGRINNLDTLPLFTNLDLVVGLESRLNTPVALDNDATVAALGEYRLGAGRSCRRLVMVTLGTGVGVALIDAGKPFRDGSGVHLEAGHLPLFDSDDLCYCGLTGCWEQAASRLSLEKRLQDIGVADLAEAEQRLDQSCSGTIPAVMREYGRIVGRGLETLNVVYGPDQFVLSGSVSRFLPYFIEGAQAEFKRSPAYFRSAPIVASELGDLAGAIGATFLIPNRW